MYSLAQVLEWKYGPIAGTKQADPQDMGINPEMEIWYWRHPTLPQPDKKQLEKDFKEYDVYMKAQKQKQKDMEVEYEDLKVKSNPSNKDVMRAFQLKDKLDKKDYN